jgi:hypothetical protein
MKQTLKWAFCSAVMAWGAAASASTFQLQSPAFGDNA